MCSGRVGAVPGHPALVLLWQIGISGLEAPFGNGLEAHWPHWLEASVTVILPAAAPVAAGRIQNGFLGVLWEIGVLEPGSSGGWIAEVP